MSKSPDAFRTISEVADWLGIQAHVLRFWESKFTQVKPVKRAGGRRYYRPADMLLLGGIKKLLHDDGLTIKGVQKIIRDQGVDFVSNGSRSLDSSALDDLGGPGAMPRVVRIQSRKPPGQAPGPDPAPAPDTTQTAAPTGPGDDADGVADSAPRTRPENDPSPVDEPEPQEVAQAGSPAPGTPVEQPADPTPEQPFLPSFLHRPAASDAPDARAPDAAPAAAPEPIPDSPSQPVPRLVEVADPPPEDEIAYRPGPLGKLARIRNLSPNQAAEIAPVIADLRALFDRLSGHPPA